MKKRYLLLFAALIFTSCGSNEPIKPIEPVAYVTQEVDIVQPEVKQYLLSNDENEQYRILYNHYINNTWTYGDKPILPTLTFNDNNNGPFTLSITSDKWKNINNYIIDVPSFTIVDPIPGYEYEWEAIDSSYKLVGQGKITIKNDVSIRYINVNNAFNTRDIGGYLGQGGNKVKYGLIYRGSQLNGRNLISSKDYDFLKNTLGIKSEVDLRNKDDDAGQIASVLAKRTFNGMDVNYIRDFENAFGNYESFLSKTTRIQTAKIIHEMADIKNYPFYVHCIGGADRTGSLCLTLNAILGVSYDNLIRDFELTSFSSYGNRWRAAGNKDNTGWDYSKNDQTCGFDCAFLPMINKIMAFGEKGEDIQTCFTKYLVTPVSEGGCGADINDINSMKAIMLGLNRDETDSRNIMETCTTGGVAVYHVDENSDNDLVINTKVLQHDYVVNNNLAICSHCGDSLISEDIDIDISKGFDFGNNVIEAKLFNGICLPISKGVVTFKREYAYDKPVGIITKDKYGVNKFYNSMLYSAFIKNEDDLFNMNNYEYQIHDFENCISSFGNFKLVDNLILTKTWNKNNALGLNTTKSSKGGFVGTFNGDNHFISNFNCIGQDSSLIYNMGEGTVTNLEIDGSSLDDFWGSDFVCAYTYGGTFSNLNISAKLGIGDVIYNNTSLLGTIGFNEPIKNKILIENVSITNPGSKQEDYSSAIGQIFYGGDSEGSLNNLLIINNLKVTNFKNILLYYSSKSSKYLCCTNKDDVIRIVGKDCVNNLIIE